MQELAAGHIRFVHRGAIVEVASAPTTKSVLYWTREDAHCVGTKQFRAMPRQIRVDAIDSLKSIAWKDDLLSTGAGASLEAAWAALVAMAPALHEMQLRFASLPLRMAGTMGATSQPQKWRVHKGSWFQCSSRIDTN